MQTNHANTPFPARTAAGGRPVRNRFLAVSHRMYNSHQEKTVMPEHDIFGRLDEPEYSEMRRTVLSRIASGRLIEDSDLSETLDSLELVELTLEAEESGVEPAADIRTVRDFL